MIGSLGGLRFPSALLRIFYSWIVFGTR